MDWISNKIYFTDASLNIVGVFDPDRAYYKVLIQLANADRPAAIVLDPINRYVDT